MPKSVPPEDTRPYAEREPVTTNEDATPSPNREDIAGQDHTADTSVGAPYEESRQPAGGEHLGTAEGARGKGPKSGGMGPKH